MADDSAVPTASRRSPSTFADPPTEPSSDDHRTDLRPPQGLAVGTLRPAPGAETAPGTDPGVAPGSLWALANYQLGEVIGRGGMGEVILAKDLRIEREVAIKRLRGERLSPELIARFTREAHIQATLDHPAIPPVHELGIDSEGRPYFAMKRLAGTTLHELLAKPAPLQRFLHPLVDVCFAIDQAHERGIVHRDLKPSNIMVGDRGDVYVLDWGVARVLGTARMSLVSLDTRVTDAFTPMGAILGTPGYMSPEQLRGDDVTPGADVFSLGAILFEILAGEPLHPRGQDAIASTLTKPGDSPARRCPARNIAPELDALCVAALAEDPATRPSARTLAIEIQRFLDGDRDLERRRALAAEQLAIAKTALASGEPNQRQVAAQAAGRALALEPASRDAQQLVTRLIIEPPDEDPPELVASLREAEHRIDRAGSRRAAMMYLALLAWVPAVATGHVQNWPMFTGLCVVTAMAWLNSWLNASLGRARPYVHAAMKVAFVLAFSRLTGVFLLVPMVIGVQVLGMASYGPFARRPRAIWLIAFTALLLPFALEQLGVLAPTWWTTSEGLLTTGQIIDTHSTVGVASLFAGEIAIVIVIAMFTIRVASLQRDAQHRARRQAWHLQQMLPREAR